MVSKDKKRVVVIGGGTGTHTLLRGLKRYADKLDITSIVTMADSGGSTGRLRDEFGQLPVGDVRMALTALSADVDDHDELLRELFLYRFDKGSGLVGHNFGNLLLTALTDILGSEVEAIETAGRILRVRGRVIPVTTDNVHLVATYDDGVVITGEHDIDEPAPDRHTNRIVELALSPEATINPMAQVALAEADFIVLGPGDLYTSILANCVVEGVAETIKNNQVAPLIYIGNLMSRPGQTIGMHSQDYVDEITKYLDRTPDYLLINNTPFPTDLTARYQAEGNHPVLFNCEEGICKIEQVDLISTEPVKTVSGDALARSYLRHDSDKLAHALLQICGQ